MWRSLSAPARVVRKTCFAPRRVALLVAFALTTGARLGAAEPVEFHVAPGGDDRNAGTRAAPFATLPRAQQAVRNRAAASAVMVWLHAGTHRLEQTLRFDTTDGGTATAPVTYAAVEGKSVEVSGARELTLHWTRAADGRWSAEVPRELAFDQLFADGAKMIRARYPNFDPGDGFFGDFAADATDPERLRRYSKLGDAAKLNHATMRT